MSSKTKTTNDHVIERDGYAEVTLTRPRQVNGVEPPCCACANPPWKTWSGSRMTRAAMHSVKCG